MIDPKFILGLINAAKPIINVVSHYIFRGLKEVDCSLQPAPGERRSIDFVYKNTYGSNIVIERVLIVEPSSATAFYRTHERTIRAGDIWNLQIISDVKQDLIFKIYWCPSKNLVNGDGIYDAVFKLVTADLRLRKKLNSAQILALPSERRPDLP